MAAGLDFSAGISACAGAEVNILADGTFDVRLVQLSLQQKMVHIDVKKQYTATLAGINPLKVKGPLAVTLTGRGVLIKKTAKLQGLTEQGLRALFPNFQMAEFYIQLFSSGEHSFVALVRKQTADPVLAAFRKTGAQPLILSLGPFVVDQALPQLNNYNGELVFDGHQLSLDGQKHWLDYSYSPSAANGFELKIDIEPIAPQFLLSYATAFQLLLNERLELIAVEMEEMGMELAELGAKLKFARNGTLVLLFFFAALLINFLVFNYYHQANGKLAGQAGQRSDVFADRQQLESDVKEKELLVKELGWNNGLDYAYVCDQIGQTVPGTITLNELSVNAPRDNAYGQAKKSELETGSMRISGKSAGIYVLNDWIYTLKQRPWVKSVQLEKYLADDQQQTQVFTILLKY